MIKLVRSLLPILLFGASVACAADSIAFITNLKGEVAIDGNPRPLLLSELAKGQKISVGKDSSASVMYIQSGKEYVLRGPSDFTVRDAEIAGSTAMPPLLRDTSWRPPAQVVTQASQTSAASVRMRSIAPAKKDEPKAIYPTQGSVASLQPTFRWRAEDPKSPGDFVLLVDGQDKPVHVAKTVGGTYRVAAKLVPEKDYSWTVSVAGSEVGGGRFRTLSGDALERIESRRPSERADFSDRILFALLLREMGAVQDARDLLAKLAQERPDLPELAAFAK